MRIEIVGAVALAMAGSAAMAADRTATQAIVSGDYAGAERTLTAERRIFPQRPEFMLNLAAVYRKTGRQAEAQALYAEVLRREAVMMDTVDQRIVSSHAIAEMGLSGLNRQMAAR